jgi:hypothetical protein
MSLNVLRERAGIQPGQSLREFHDQKKAEARRQEIAQIWDQKGMVWGKNTAASSLQSVDSALFTDPLNSISGLLGATRPAEGSSGPTYSERLADNIGIFNGMDTNRAPMGRRVACAYRVRAFAEQVLGKDLFNGNNMVSGQVAILDRLVSQGLARRVDADNPPSGAIAGVVLGDRGHIGIAHDGLVNSNSSSTGRIWRSTVDAMRAYHGGNAARQFAYELLARIFHKF